MLTEICCMLSHMLHKNIQSCYYRKQKKEILLASSSFTGGHSALNAFPHATPKRFVSATKGKTFNQLSLCECKIQDFMSSLHLFQFTSEVISVLWKLQRSHCCIQLKPVYHNIMFKFKFDFSTLD